MCSALGAVRMTAGQNALRGSGPQAFKHHEKGITIPVDTPLDEADPKDFDGLVLPGGVIMRRPDCDRSATAAAAEYC
jgi:putative intracellular protease/amidase